MASLVFLRLGADHECDKEVCVFSPEERQRAGNPERDSQLNLALLNHGVQSGTRFLLNAALSDKDIDDTVDALGKSLDEVRQQVEAQQTPEG